MQLQYLPLRNYFYNITLLIMTFYVKMRSCFSLYYFMLLISSHILHTQLCLLEMASCLKQVQHTKSLKGGML